MPRSLLLYRKPLPHRLPQRFLPQQRSELFVRKSLRRVTAYFYPRQLSGGVIAGIVVGILALIASLVVVFVILRRRKGNSSYPDTRPRPNEMLPTRSSLIPMPTTCLNEKARANLRDVGRCVTPGPGPSSPGRHTGNSSDVDNTVLPVTSSITLPESVMVASTDLTAHSFSPSSAISPGNGLPSPLRPTQPGRTEPDPSTVERIVDIVAERIAQHFHQHDGRVTPPPVYREILHN